MRLSISSLYWRRRQIFSWCYFTLNFIRVFEEFIEEIYSIINTIQYIITQISRRWLKLLNISCLLFQVHRLIWIESSWAVLTLHIDLAVLLSSQTYKYSNICLSSLLKLPLLSLLLFRLLSGKLSLHLVFLKFLVQTQRVIVVLHLPDLVLGQSTPIDHHWLGRSCRLLSTAAELIDLKWRWRHQ